MLGVKYNFPRSEPNADKFLQIAVREQTLQNLRLRVAGMCLVQMLEASIFVMTELAGKFYDFCFNHFYCEEESCTPKRQKLARKWKTLSNGERKKYNYWLTSIW